MIYLFTALYCEADIFIKKFHLVKILENTRFQEFYQEEDGIRLTVTGTGEVAAATAVSSVCTKHRPQEGDILLNIGTCARIAGNNGVFVCNKIIEQATGKTFYPDLLYRHDLQEETIVTGMMLCNQSQCMESEITLCNEYIESEMMSCSAENFNGCLYDMEAAAIYQAGSYFFGPHQMMFLKVVSDKGAAAEVSREKITHLMETYQEVLYDFIEGLPVILYGNQRKANALQQEGMRIETLCEDLHCSKVMRDSLTQHIHYWELAGSNYTSVIQDMYREGMLPCKDKREGKSCFEELKRRLF